MTGNKFIQRLGILRSVPIEGLNTENKFGSSGTT